MRIGALKIRTYHDVQDYSRDYSILQHHQMYGTPYPLAPNQPPWLPAVSPAPSFPEPRRRSSTDIPLGKNALLC